MAKVTSSYQCSSCSATFPKWQGKCGKCGEFGTISENATVTAARPGSVGIKGDMRAASVSRPARRVGDIDTTAHRHTTTGIGELDRILGGGFVAGAVILFSAEPGFGKALALDTEMATPDGWTTMGEVQVGDQLIGWNGKPTTVVAATEPMAERRCFRIEFSDGSTVVADAGHQWYTQTRYDRVRNVPASVRTTQEIFDTQHVGGKERRANHSVPLAMPIAGHTADLPIPPYTLGAWLGDGTSANTTITSVTPVDSVPVRCVQVDNEDHTYLVTRSFIPTHNSTLSLSLANNYATTGKTVLYISGEESAEQITIRARRIGALNENLLIADETDLSVILGHIEQTQPDLVIVDSVQTIASPDVEGRAGGVSQVHEVSATLVRVAKSLHIPMVVIAQITKDGSIAGPKTLEHLVDVVLIGTGDTNTSLRILRTQKNRYGASDETAVWEQTDTGMREIPDPSELFRTGRDEPVAGTCVTVAMEGKRPLLAEVQALVSPTNAPNPRRGVSGLDTARMAMLVAVTERHGRIKLFDKDSFLATVAGMRIVEPAADLAVCLALASAAWDAPLPQDVAAVGEVALSGDLRQVSSMAQRLSEAARLGYRRAIVPTGTKKPNGTDLVLIEVPHVSRAFAALKQMSPRADETT
jgi:DNA repair protein RadA/Sms